MNLDALNPSERRVILHLYREHDRGYICLDDVIKAQQIVLDTAEARLVADPSYTPTVEEAMRHPNEFVEGMTELRRTAHRRPDGSIEVTPWEEVP
jgi:hypothetical protein